MVSRDLKTNRSFFSPSLASKAAMALAVCCTVRLLVAQAPPPTYATVADEVDAQGYKIQSPSKLLSVGPKAKSEEQKYRSSVRQILSGTLALNADPLTRRNFGNYFLGYLFPLMTTEEGMKSLASDRQSFLRDLQSAKSTEAHTELINLTLPAMQRIVQDDAYRLSARYNAMLIIGSLNDQEPNPYIAPPTLPEPMRQALPFILQQFQRPDNHDSIKTAALLGLGRHLEWDNYKQAGSPPINPAGKSEIIKELIALAETKQPPAGRDASVHNWMRRRAIEGLGLACLTRPDAQVAAAMEKLLKDESDALNVRTAVAVALGRMSLQAPANLDAVATAKELGFLALVACDAELNKAESYRKTEYEREARLMGTYTGEDYSGAGGPGGMGMGGYGSLGGIGGGLGGDGTGRVMPVRPQPGMSTEGSAGLGGGEYGLPGTGMDPSMMDPKHYRVEYLRRRLRQHLYAVQLGLAGTDDFAPPRTTPGGNPPATTQVAKTANEAAPPAEKRGMHAIAKAKPDQDAVKDVYYKVRRLAEIVEASGAEADFFQLIKDLRKELKPLEAITKRLPPAGGAVPATVADDAPTLPGSKGPGGKAAPKPASTPAAPKGKGSTRLLPRTQPSVFAKPRR